MSALLIRAKYTRFFCKLAVDPDSLRISHKYLFSERSEEREARETDHFSSDHYLCDLYESDEIDHIVR